MTNSQHLRALYAALDGLLNDLDANGSAETAAASLQYHLKQNGLVIREARAASPSGERASAQASGSSEPSTDALRAAFSAITNAIATKRSMSAAEVRRLLEAVAAEARAASAQAGAPGLDVERLGLLLDAHRPHAVVRTFPRIDCSCGWEGMDWPVHLYRVAAAYRDAEREGQTDA